jgi:hypothetical protein
MLDLFHASRDELIKLLLAERDRSAALEQRVARQQQEIATLQATIAQLTTRLGERLAEPAPAAGEPGGGDDGPAAPRRMPGLKPTQPPARPPAARRRRAHGFARRRMTPTAQQVHALAHCPACGAPLAGGTPKRCREVLEVPVAPVVVTEHVYLERRCPDCGRRCVPTPELAGVVPGRSRLGVGLVSLIAVLREEARLPYATIQRLLRTLYGLHLSVGALVGAMARVATQGKPAVETIRAAIRASPVVHADETGWRENGRNGYAWTLSTPTQQYFVRGTREKAVLEEALGEAFAGVLVSDCYVAYTNYEGRHQYCWAHLLRDVHELAQRHRRNAAVQGWADAVQDLFRRAQAFASPDPRVRRQAALGFAAELQALCAPYLPPPAKPAATAPTAAAASAPPTPPAAAEPAQPAEPAAATEPTAKVPPWQPSPQTGLCQRFERHLAELFVFVEDPAVPPTNNAAERSLRHLVVSRKISGGTRSDVGSTTKMRLASLFGTWRAQGRDPLTECRQLLAAPQG